ncbi:MAG: NFACT RNA binding domain-containing protein [Chitinophagaceae bacterium]
MNHLNGLILESLCHTLQNHCKDQQIIDCFSNSQDEFILAFPNFYIKCLFYKGEIYFFTGESAPAKSRLFKPQFTEIHETFITEIVPHPFERSFHFRLSDNHNLVFKCHGRKSNILLMNDQQCTDTFKRHLEKDAELSLSDVYRPVVCSFNEQALSDSAQFKLFYPYLPVELFDELQHQPSSVFDSVISSYRHLKHISFDKDSFEIKAGKSDLDFLDALNQFGNYCIKTRTFSEQRQTLLNQCLQAISDKEHFISSNKKALDILAHKRPDGELGNIILSSLHIIKPGMTSVVLNDIYNNTNIEIALDPDLNAVENAEKYFKKEKSLPHSIRLLESKIANAKKILEDLQNKLQIIENASDFKGLKILVKQHKKEQDQEHLPYRKFEFEGFDIFVGKHADSNEKLLNYYSDKNDTWLHAKDVSGSHVIIKSGKNNKIPESVLEKAASLAAYYSRNRKQNLVTVTYTLRKFVRKIKGAEKGKVSVSGEKTLLVKPSL